MTSSYLDQPIRTYAEAKRAYDFKTVGDYLKAIQDQRGKEALPEFARRCKASADWPNDGSRRTAVAA